jgi:hypothetical protein
VRLQLGLGKNERGTVPPSLFLGGSSNAKALRQESDKLFLTRLSVEVKLPLVMIQAGNRIAGHGEGTDLRRRADASVCIWLRESSYRQSGAG